MAISSTYKKYMKICDFDVLGHFNDLGVATEAYRGAFHSQKISYTFGKNPFVSKKNPSKIRINPFVLKKSRTLFPMSEVPLGYNKYFLYKKLKMWASTVRYSWLLFTKILQKQKH